MGRAVCRLVKHANAGNKLHKEVPGVTEFVEHHQLARFVCEVEDLRCELIDAARHHAGRKVVRMLLTRQYHLGVTCHTPGWALSCARGLGDM